ncbi:hypothetical protein GCM10027079_08450 [Sediminivirga luteola]|uniref:Uncharacterized protein n=1 Tax=Sediminivirga luteola TaxID=1774748 RepID=A0A8J2TZG0_9MICO|nr:hypothetical protein GCM10011333_24160 [Sediminivirga luteola]
MVWTNPADASPDALERLSPGWGNYVESVRITGGRLWAPGQGVHSGPRLLAGCPRSDTQPGLTFPQSFPQL